MRIYDLVLVFKSSLATDKRKKLIDTVTSWVKDGKMTKTEEWGSKPLSYPIKKEVSGHYVYMILESEIGVPTDFEKKILAQDDILRHLLVRTK
ncbi:MAG: 30S ribosomal protein S6 [Candidatus Levybacteria bacterium]|nr:30S ribosomal protein S6 [Candidatus Levybacteria bacterium]